MKSQDLSANFDICYFCCLLKKHGSELQTSTERRGFS